MSDPQGPTPLTAGERLSPRATTAAQLARNAAIVAAASPPPPEPPAAEPRQRRVVKPRRKRGPIARLFAWLMSLAIVGGVVTVAAGFAVVQHYGEDLPDHETLTHYQPPMMSRVYAGDSRLLAELATERRIFVPYAAVPELVKRTRSMLKRLVTTSASFTSPS